MKAVSHKIYACLLALMVLFSTLSFTVDMHFCGHHLIDFSLYQEADNCGMDMQGMEKMGCCQDVELAVQGQEDLQLTWDHISFDYPELAIFLEMTFFGDRFEILKKQPNTFKDYAPPPLIEEIHLLDETFLI